MKKRTRLILLLVLAAMLALGGSTLWENAAQVWSSVRDRLPAMLSLRHNATAVLQVQNHFMVRSGSRLVPETGTHLDAAQYPDQFDWLPTQQVTLNGVQYTLWNEQVLRGAADKFLTVENQGNCALCFRTCIAMPVSDMQRALVINRNTRDYLWTDGLQTTIDGVDYVMYVASYRHVLPAGQTAPASLLQIALQKHAPIRGITPFDLRVTTLTVSADGFDHTDALRILDQTLPIGQDFAPFR